MVLNGIESELTTLGIKFDVSRRIARNNQFLNYISTSIGNEVSDFPTQVEMANDDNECFCAGGPSDLIDEDAIPSMDKLFSYDAPSEECLANSRAFSIRRLQFKEFVRVSFGIDISGDIQEGSKCSDAIDWEIQYSLVCNTSLNPADPYDGMSQLLRPVELADTYHSLPRRLIGAGNGLIRFNSFNSSDVVSYFLKYNSISNKWSLSARKTGGSMVVAESGPPSVTGVWTINYTTVNLTISPGTIPFSKDALFTFNIMDLPLTLNHIITY